MSKHRQSRGLPLSWLNAPVDELGDRMWRQPVVRVICTMLWFAVMGPVIGALAVALVVAGGSLLNGEDFGTDFVMLIVFTPVGVASSFLFAFSPAVAAGVFFGIVDFGRGRSNLVLAVIVGAVGGWLWPLAWALPPSELSSFDHLFIASIVSTLVCWFASTRGAHRRERTAAP